MYKVTFQRYIGRYQMTGWTLFHHDGDRLNALAETFTRFPGMGILDVEYININLNKDNHG